MGASNLAEILRSATVGPRPSLDEQATETLAACTDIAGLAGLASSNRVAPWLSAAIKASAGLPENSRYEAVHQAGMIQTFRSLALFGEMTTVLSQLNELEIPVVVLKGPVLAESHYPDPGLRPFGDIDILIHEANLEAVSAVLRQRGYEDKNEDTDPNPHRLHECHGIFQRIFIHPNSGHIIEVHCDHLQIGLEPVSMDRIWETSSDRLFGRASARALEDHDMFVQLCVHLNRHGYERLIWFKDIDLMVRSGTLDWVTVEVKAREQGCLAAVSYTLWLLPKILGTPMPPGAVQLSRRQGILSRILFKRMWPLERVLQLEPQRQWRFRRLVQFAPETGVVRGGLPSLLTTGRTKDKLRVLFASGSKR
ncbi:MAG: nucleotidyltransferase family protein [Dehalococcoidia bacterium]